MSVLVRYDSEADATFVQLDSDAAVARTVEVLDGHLMVDVDGLDSPIGIEILCAPADIDEVAYVALADRFSALDIEAIRAALAGRSAATA